MLPFNAQPTKAPNMEETAYKISGYKKYERVYLLKLNPQVFAMNEVSTNYCFLKSFNNSESNN